MNHDTMEEALYRETEKRLNEMEDSRYEFPEKITSTDVIVIAAMAAVCILLIFLCMAGVIK